MAKKNFLESIHVPAPCNASWEDMLGNDRKRFCLGCEKDVYNLAAMSRSEAISFVSKNEGKACIRYGRMSDGTVQTTDRKLVSITRNGTAVAAGVIAASLTLAAAAYSQCSPVALPKDGKTAISSEAKSKSGTSQISFTIYDENRAVITSAQVELTDQVTGREFITTTDQVGVARFSDLPHGRYDVLVSALDFQSVRREVLIKESIEVNLELRLPVGVVTGDFTIEWSEIPLFNAIAQEDNDTVKQFILSGFNVNTRDDSGRTALHIAVEHGNLELVHFLLDRGAKINAKTKDKRTPIWMLDDNEEDSSLDILRLLISKGADVNILNEDRETLLMAASDDDDLEVVKILLDAGANPNIKDEDGETAIQKTSSDEIKQLLIKHGAKQPK